MHPASGQHLTEPEPKEGSTSNAHPPHSSMEEGGVDSSRPIRPLGASPPMSCLEEGEGLCPERVSSFVQAAVKSIQKNAYGSAAYHDASSPLSGYYSNSVVESHGSSSPRSDHGNSRHPRLLKTLKAFLPFYQLAIKEIISHCERRIRGNGGEDTISLNGSISTRAFDGPPPDGDFDEEGAAIFRRGSSVLEDGHHSGVAGAHDITMDASSFLSADSYNPNYYSPYESIQGFLLELSRKMRTDQTPLVYTAALVYLSRIARKAEVGKSTSVTSRNWFRLTVISILIAFKMYSEFPGLERVNRYVAATARIPLKKINHLEIDFLYFMDFDLCLTPGDLECWLTWMERLAYQSGMENPLHSFLLASPLSRVPSTVAFSGASTAVPDANDGMHDQYSTLSSALPYNGEDDHGHDVPWPHPYKSSFVDCAVVISPVLEVSNNESAARLFSNPHLPASKPFPKDMLKERAAGLSLPLSHSPLLLEEGSPEDTLPLPPRPPSPPPPPSPNFLFKNKRHRKGARKTAKERLAEARETHSVVTSTGEGLLNLATSSAVAIAATGENANGARPFRELMSRLREVVHFTSVLTSGRLNVFTPPRSAEEGDALPSPTVLNETMLPPTHSFSSRVNSEGMMPGSTSESGTSATRSSSVPFHRENGGWRERTNKEGRGFSLSNSAEIHPRGDSYDIEHDDFEDDFENDELRT